MIDLKELISNKPLIACHRGNSSGYEENTLAAFMSVINKGFSLIEIDIQWTADDVIICYHNNNIMCYDGVEQLISKINYSEIVSVDKLSDVIDNLSSRAYFIIEIKPIYSPTTEKNLVQLYNLFADLDILHQVVFVSDDINNLIYMKKIDTEVRTAAILIDNFNLQELKKLTNCDAIICHINELDNGLAISVKTNNLLLGVFGVEEIADVVLCLQYKVNIIGTDNPILISSYLEELFYE